MKLTSQKHSKGDKKFTPTQVLINPNKSCIRIYTDGSCLINPGGAGTYSFVIVENDQMIHEYGEHYKSTTNNRMEIKAVSNAIEYISSIQVDQVVVYTDSTYVYNAIMKKAGKQAAKNGDLLERLKVLVADNPHIQYMWTKGHAGQKWNEHADELCRKMYQKVPIPDTGYELVSHMYQTPVKKLSDNVTNAKQFLLDNYLPITPADERELWYRCSDWARTVVQIMEKYKNQ
jgi:ribonuclease HI